MINGGNVRRNLGAVAVNVVVILALALNLLLFPQPAVASPETASDSAANLTYTVRPGDTLHDISLRFGSTVRAIVEANRLQNPDLIWPGQELMVPPSTPSAESSVAGNQPGGATTVQTVQQERFSPAPRAESQPPDFVMTEREWAMLAGINAKRVAAGLPELRFDAALMPVAHARSDDMATRGYFSHTTPEGATVEDVARAAGVNYPVVSEILARNNYPVDQSVEVSINAFMNSPNHRAHIESPVYNVAAVAEAIATNGMRYYTVVLASR